MKDSSLILLHVQKEPVNDDAPLPACVNDLAELLRAEGWPFDTVIRQGDDPAEIIKQVTDVLAVSLIVMSTHGRSGLERIREGSVTENVVRESNCPVFILHSQRAEPADQRSSDLFQRVLVPLDGTRGSAAILPCVQRFAGLHDAEVILFHDSPKESGITHTRTLLEEQSVAMANAGIKVSIDWTSYRHPIREILNKIDEKKIDLVAMATHTAEQTCHPLESSVTADVIRHANCPLLVWSAAHCTTEGMP
jgi:nucleotide-binding universal stress UspA family protein